MTCLPTHTKGAGAGDTPPEAYADGQGGSRAESAALPFVGLSDKIASVTRDAQVYQAALEIAGRLAVHDPDEFTRKWWAGIAMAVTQGRNSLLNEQRKLMEEAGTERLLKDVLADG